MANPTVVIRVVAPVMSGKTHIAETIRKALVAEYGDNICVALTDIDYDKRTQEDGPMRPPEGVAFKIIEDHGNR